MSSCSPALDAKRVTVAVRPPAPGLGGDRLFHGDTYRHVGDASHWLEPARSLARIGRDHGVEFHTDDMVTLASAAVLVLSELPMSRRSVQVLRRAHPHLKLILQIVETPLGRAWVFDPRNHADFDAILSYHPALDDGKRYFAYKIPAGGVGTIAVRNGVPWEQRKVACLVANVPNARPFLIRRSGLGLVRNGWRFTPATWWNYVTEGGSMYRERLQIAAACEDALGDRFDIFGPGWTNANRPDGLSRRFASARGPYDGSKLLLLQHYRFGIAYENCVNDCGYISEKLFDCLLAGCVPVYLGNQSIDRYVPADVFIDARQFSSREKLIEFMSSMPVARWQQMRDAGNDFLARDAISLFGSAQYVDAVLRAVRQVTSRPQAA